jgi:hypothetical protein
VRECRGGGSWSSGAVAVAFVAASVVGTNDWVDLADDYLVGVVGGEPYDEQVDVAVIRLEYLQVFDVA